MNENKRNVKSVINSTIYILKFSMKEKCCRAYAILQVILSLLSILPTIILTIMPGLIVNELIYQSRIITLIILISTVVFIPFIYSIIRELLNKKLTALELTLSSQLKKSFGYYVANMDYETLENPDIQTLRTRAQGVYVQPLNTINTIIKLITAIISFISMSAVIITLNPLIIVIVLVVVCINYFISKNLKYKQFINGK